ncbi:MAG TPA: DUF2934 domain-containing protein [Burkholderiales bacterium]|nr:DUF2934 domain-containing protein [Burkholderiales bacterium]
MATRKPPAKKASSRKSRSAPPFTGGMQPDPSPEELWKQIAEAAYYRAKARDFAPGGEVQDWIEAEAEVMQRLGRTP